MKEEYTKLIGEKINNVTINNVYVKNGFCMASYECDCGVKKSTRIYSLLDNTTKSCGCYNRKSKTKYEYNVDLFKSFSPSRNYILGLLASDGCITSGKNEVSINLKDDKEILEKISLLIKRRVDIKTHKNVYNSTMYCLRFCNKNIVEELERLGIHSKKSKSYIVNSELSNCSHFWRGMIDGDGWVNIVNYKKKSKTKVYINTSIRVGISGTEDVCQKFKYFCETFRCGFNVKVRKHKTINNFATFCVTGKEALRMLEVLYKDKGELYLARKFVKYQNHKLTFLK